MVLRSFIIITLSVVLRDTNSPHFGDKNVITFKFLFSTIFIIQVSAINLNFFNFKHPPTKILSQTNNQSSVISVPFEAHKSSSIDPRIQNVKHELENETEGPDAFPEDTSDTTLVITPEQEIDETEGDLKYQINEDVSEEKFKFDKDKSFIWQYLPSLPNKFPKIPSLLKQKTTIFTTTVTSYTTKYETVYPSCVKLQNVKSKCDGKLRTIIPTATQSPTVEKTKTLQSRESYIERRSIEEQSAEIDIVKSSTIPISRELLEPSEMDNEYEYLKPDELMKTTSINSTFLDHLKNSSFFASLLANEPKVEFKTEYLTHTAIQTITDHSATATVIVHNCLPSDIDLKHCHSNKPIPVNVISATSVILNEPKSTQNSLKTGDISPVLENLLESILNKSKSTQNSSKTCDISPVLENSTVVDQKKINLTDKVKEYIMMNANRFIWSKPTYEEVDFNKDSVIIKPFPFPWYAAAHDYLITPNNGMMESIGTILK